LFIDAVLNSAALLLIVDIDDMFPVVLDLDTADIVQIYLNKQSIWDFNALYTNMRRKQVDRIPQPKQTEFSDMDLTNTVKHGTDVEISSIFAPYKIEGSSFGIGISPFTYVTEDCLISRLEFSYTEGYLLLTCPCIGYLQATMLKDGTVHELVEKGLHQTSYHDIHKCHRIYVVNPHEETREAYIQLSWKNHLEQPIQEAETNF
jgi:hypothetical protein